MSTTDDDAATEALAQFGGMEWGIRYIVALTSVVKNYPPQMTMEDKAVCTAAATHLMETAQQTDDYLPEALRHCTPIERGWCMWLHVVAKSIADRLTDDA